MSTSSASDVVVADTRERIAGGMTWQQVRAQAGGVEEARELKIQCLLSPILQACQFIVPANSGLLELPQFFARAPLLHCLHPGLDLIMCHECQETEKLSHGTGFRFNH